MGLPWAPVNNYVNSHGGQITLFCRLKQDEDLDIEKIIPNQYAPQFVQGNRGNTILLI